MGLWKEQPVSSFKGLKLSNESSLPTLSKWEWFSEPLDCPPNEGCKPEPMVGTMNPLEGNPRPSRAGRKSVEFLALAGIVEKKGERYDVDDATRSIAELLLNTKELEYYN